MSVVKDTGFKHMECGDLHHSEQMIRDNGGGYVDFQIVGTDPDIPAALVNASNPGVIIGNNITAITGDYAPDADHKNADGTFFICIEATGVFHVTLFDGSDFIITAVQSTAYLGQWYPVKIWSVNAGTSGNFSVGY